MIYIDIILVGIIGVMICIMAIVVDNYKTQKRKAESLEMELRIVYEVLKKERDRGIKWNQE